LHGRLYEGKHVIVPDLYALAREGELTVRVVVCASEFGEQLSFIEPALCAEVCADDVERACAVITFGLEEKAGRLGRLSGSLQTLPQFGAPPTTLPPECATKARRPRPFSAISIVWMPP